MAVVSSNWRGVAALGMPIMFPIKPLIDYVEAIHFANSDAIIAHEMGISRRQYQRLKNKEKIRWDTADRHAVRLGLHPVLIWEDWYIATRGLKE